MEYSTVYVVPKQAYSHQTVYFSSSQFYIQTGRQSCHTAAIGIIKVGSLKVQLTFLF